ncbi:transporter [Lewinella sp. IMCC34183]|uniref:transporter n=1 Tax=Lewinella sp. IMCC34183 TaxID=2248762 RepID=UPI000E2678D8|nr:transporter [Lewinella sp. IMCC34183]
MKYFCLILLLVPGFLAAQYRPTIVTGRPGQAIGGLTVGRQVYQVQTGLNIGWVGDDPDRVQNFTETTVLRVGLLKHLEVSGVLGVSSVESVTPTGRIRERGISNTQIGARYNFLQNDGWRPSLAFQGRALLTAQDEAFRRDRTGAAFIVSAGWSLTDVVGFTANLNRSWTGNDTRTTGYVTTLGFSLSDKWSSFVEMYGALSDDFTTNFDGGFAYLVSPNVALDASAGWDGNSKLDSYFVNFGISFRFDGRNEADDGPNSRINEF